MFYRVVPETLASFAVLTSALDLSDRRTEVLFWSGRESDTSSEARSTD
jgi:hypothetical protein